MRRSIRRFCFLFLCFCLILMTGCKEKTEEQISLGQMDTKKQGEDAKEADTVKETDVLYIYVCGRVRCPGVYELPQGSRIYQAIDAAGGMTEDAVGSYLNQAEKLEDGQQIYVPSREEAEAGAAMAGGGAGKVQKEDDGKVSLNTATKEQLMTLTGIGEVKAEAIILYREEHGGFRSIEELKEIEGIKNGIFQKVKDQIKI